VLLPSAVATPTAAAPARLSLVDDFDAYVPASLREQGPWHVNTPGAADGAVASGDVPTDLSGKALLDDLDGQGGPIRYRGNAYATLGPRAVPAGATGTVFFELATRSVARTKLHLGLSADASPGLGMDTTGDPLDLADFGPQLTVDRRGLVARDGATERPLTGFPLDNGVRYRIWLVVDNATHTFSVHAAAATGEPVALTSTSGRSTFAFRSAPGGDLVTFLHLNDPVDVPTADSYLDSLYVAPDGVDLTDPSPRLTLVNNFDHLAMGAVDGQLGWSASSGVEVTKGPAGSDGRVLSIRPGSRRASRELPAMSPGGTVFFRMRRSGTVNGMLGAGVAGSPSLDRLRLQTGATTASSPDQVVRDGDASTNVGTWSDRSWRCVWLVGDADGQHFSAYGRGGDLRVTTRLRAGAQDTFGVHGGSADAVDPEGVLDHFLAVTSQSTGTVQVDHLAVDQTQRDLRTPAGAACPHTGPGPVLDPASARPQPARLELSLTEVAQLDPAAAGSPARRANTVVPLGRTSGRLAVPTLEGQVLALRDGTPSTYLDVRREFPSFVDKPGLGTGLGYVAFAPDFDTTGRFYTVHTEAGAALTDRTPSLPSPPDTRIHGVVTEWTAADPAADTFAGTHREVLRIGFSRFTHGIQQIDFDPTARAGDADYGLLYLGIGDGDETPFFSTRPGDLRAPQGKVLRIDPRATAGGAAYSVPAGNPFVGRSDALPEVYASGLRNPHRFAWDARTGRLLVSNIGEKNVDSVYEVRPGADFGWNRREGAYVFDPADPNEVYPLPRVDHSGVTYPVLQIGRHAGISLVGAGVYRGRLTALRGHYLFGDIVSGAIREIQSGLLAGATLPEPAFHNVSLVVDGRRTSLAALTDGRVDVRFGRDQAGELYVLSKSLGRVWKVTAARDLTPARPSCFTGSSSARPTGAGDWKPLTPSRWSFAGSEARQLRPGSRPSGVNRPYEYALVRNHRAGSFDFRAQVRVERPGPVAERDVVLVFGYRSATQFAYAHLSDDRTSYAHNGLFVVDRADRRRIDDQYDLKAAPPAITDRAWHDVRLVHCAGQRATWLFVDGHTQPLMTATDSAVGPGLLGFGSFNDFGRVRDVRIRYARS
jgi:hypothetical protein